MAEVDRRVALNGIVAAAQWLLTQIVTGIDARGTEHIPRTGPVLIASNHPGAYDIVALIAGIGRDDIKIIASGVPFTRSLIATSPHLIYVNPDNLGAPDRMVAIRSGIRHLQDGGALLIYPTGIVDPDPDIAPGLEESIDDVVRQSGDFSAPRAADLRGAGHRQQRLEPALLQQPAGEDSENRLGETQTRGDDSGQPPDDGQQADRSDAAPDVWRSGRVERCCAIQRDIICRPSSREHGRR